jgi:hypothetical protein
MVDLDFNYFFSDTSGMRPIITYIRVLVKLKPGKFRLEALPIDSEAEMNEYHLYIVEDSQGARLFGLVQLLHQLLVSQLSCACQRVASENGKKNDIPKLSSPKRTFQNDVGDPCLSPQHSRYLGPLSTTI